MNAGDERLRSFLLAIQMDQYYMSFLGQGIRFDDLPVLVSNPANLDQIITKAFHKKRFIREVHALKLNVGNVQNANVNNNFNNVQPQPIFVNEKNDIIVNQMGNVNNNLMNNNMNNVMNQMNVNNQPRFNENLVQNNMRNNMGNIQLPKNVQRVIEGNVQNDKFPSPLVNNNIRDFDDVVNVNKNNNVNPNPNPNPQKNMMNNVVQKNVVVNNNNNNNNIPMVVQPKYEENNVGRMMKKLMDKNDVLEKKIENYGEIVKTAELMKNMVVERNKEIVGFKQVIETQNLEMNDLKKRLGDLENMVRELAANKGSVQVQPKSVMKEVVGQKGWESWAKEVLISGFSNVSIHYLPKNCGVMSCTKNFSVSNEECGLIYALFSQKIDVDLKKGENEGSRLVYGIVGGGWGVSMCGRSWVAFPVTPKIIIVCDEYKLHQNFQVEGFLCARTSKIMIIGEFLSSKDYKTLSNHVNVILEKLIEEKF